MKNHIATFIIVTLFGGCGSEDAKDSWNAKHALAYPMDVVARTERIIQDHELDFTSVLLLHLGSVLTRGGI